MSTIQPSRKPKKPSGAKTGVADEALIESIKTDYAAYLGTCWPYLSSGKAPYGELERDVFSWACGRQPGRSNNRFLFAHREFGKSTGITYALPGFIWLSNPAATGAVYTKSARKAVEALMAARGLLRKHPLLKRLQPPKNSWHKDAFDHFYVAGATNEAVPSLKVLGSTSQSTGGRIDFGIFDDFETPENSITREARERTLERFHEIIRTARDDSLKIVVGTYARDQSMYAALIDEGWEHRIYPLLYPTDEEIELATNKKTGECYYAPLILKWLRRGYDNKNRPVRAGDRVQPERFSVTYLAEKKAGSLAEFRRHYMGIRQSAATDEYVLRLSDFIVYGCSGPVAPGSFLWATTTGKQQRSTIRDDIEVDAFGTDAFRAPAAMDDIYLPFQSPTAMHVDPTGYGKDELAWAVASRLNGNYFARKVAGTRLRPEDVPKDQENRLTIAEAVNAIVNDIARFDVRLCNVESQFGGPYLAELI